VLPRVNSALLKFFEPIANSRGDPPDTPQFDQKNPGKREPEQEKKDEPKPQPSTHKPKLKLVPPLPEASPQDLSPTAAFLTLSAVSSVTNLSQNQQINGAEVYKRSIASGHRVGRSKKGIIFDDRAE